MQKRFDTIVFKDLKILQSEEFFGYSSDTLLLIDFITETENLKEKKFKLIELGSGTGGFCIVIAKQNKDAKIVGIDIQPEVNELANESVKLNEIDNVSFKNIDLRNVNNFFFPESFNYVVANPPYFKLGTGRINKNFKKAKAKHEVNATLFDFFKSAYYLLKKTGKFFLIHHYSRIYDVFQYAIKFKLKLVYLQPVYVDENQLFNNSIFYASHCLFAFSKSYKKEPLILSPRFIRKSKI